QESAFAYQRSIENKERVVVGVNQFRTGEDEPIPLHSNDPELERTQIEQLETVRRTRDAQAVSECLRALENAAATNDNLMPHIVTAVQAYATVGEISDAFRRVHGEYREALVS